MGSIAVQSDSIEYTAFKGSKSGKISAVEITHAPLGPNEVEVKMLYSGLCGTDEHMRHNVMVLGHEGVGEVLNVGDRVTELSP
jgi:D-arabinose 1-dehydrogenase-like Zn-dependent alcohol dehydrogenase